MNKTKFKAKIVKTVAKISKAFAETKISKTKINKSNF